MRFAAILVTIASSCLCLAAPHLQDHNAGLVEPLTPGNVTAELEKRSGQGGYLNLINGGSYTWRKTHQASYQMNSWSFPDTVGPYSSQRLYIEFDTTFPRNRADDGGEATYQLDGTSWSFQVQARAPGGSFTLQTVLLSMATQNNAQGSTIPIGWKWDGTVNWILSGQFTSSRAPANWMQTNLGEIGGLTLRQLSMPGSHDSGMSRITGGTAFGRDCNSLTQTRNFADQLVSGARYFDVRPIITAGNYGTGHYTGDAAVLNTFQGANGQPISEIVSQVNAFTANNRELVIINLSHSLNTDVGTSDYRPFTQAEWDGCLQQLMGINNLLTTSALPAGFNTTSGDLSTLRLNQFITGRAAVVLVVQDSANLNSWYGRGVFNYDAAGGVYNSYSNSNNVGTMRNDQISKIQTTNARIKLLSWTLTQDSTQAALCTKSIIQLANEANPVLYTDLINAIRPTSGIVPNIIYQDNIENTDTVGIAMAYNWWQSHH